MNKIQYLYRKGRIVVYKSDGKIVKVLARPGQIVYDPIIKDIYILRKGEYILKDFRTWLTGGEYLVPQGHTQPAIGNIYTEIDLALATVYEKLLRRKGICVSPNYNSKEPQGDRHEVIVSKRALTNTVKPLMLTILTADFMYDSPVFELSNGTHITKGTLKTLFRKPTNYEQKYYYRITQSLQL